MSTPTPINPSLAQSWLDRREAELRAVLAAAGDSGAHVPDASTPEVSDFKEQAEDAVQAQLNDAQAEHARAELALVAAARQRLAGGDYGACQSCGADIDPRRLQAMPAAPFCTHCQAQREAA